MKSGFFRISLISGMCLAGGLPLQSWGSSHREAPAISNDPSADNTDLYAWVTPGTHDKVYILANWIPLEEPAGGPNFHKFSDDVLYEIHIARGAKSLQDVVTYQFRFTTAPIQKVDPADLKAPPGGGKEFFAQLAGAYNQRYVVTKIEKGVATDIAGNIFVAPPRIGPRSQQVTNALGVEPFDYSPVYDDAFASNFIVNMGGDEGRVFAGPRDDGFYVDLGGIFDLAHLRPRGVAQDNVAGYNTHTIALEIPTAKLTGTGKPPTSTEPNDETTLGIWASSSRQRVSVLEADGSTSHSGPWVQVSRLGLPLINEAVIGYQDKDRYNRTYPQDDVTNFGAYFLNPVIVRDAEAVGIYADLGVDPTEFKSGRLDIIDTINLKDIPTPDAHHIPLEATGDVLRLDMSIDSGFPNGRPLLPGTNREQADVTDVLLSVLLTKGRVTISDGVDYNDKVFLSYFPFLALPWQGFDEGHGQPTPSNNEPLGVNNAPASL